LQGECDPDFGGMFVFDIHAKELIVGEIFVRVYNEQPTFPLEVSLFLVPHYLFLSTMFNSHESF